MTRREATSPLVLWWSAAVCWSACAATGLCGQPEVAGEAFGSKPGWIRAPAENPFPVWGWNTGLLFGLHPCDGSGQWGPRGLIRIGYPVLQQNRYDLINFIAVEPIVGGRRGFSELEVSQLDRVPGKRMWVAAQSGEPAATVTFEPGSVTTLPSNAEQLEVVLRVERFNNGAHVYLVLAQRSDVPDEISLAIHAEADSQPLEYCVLTATMGNKARTRLLWLREGAVNSRDLYPDYRGPRFAPHTVFSLSRLWREPLGDVLVALTTDEEDPAEQSPFPGTKLWYYGGTKVTQYWRKPQDSLRTDLHGAVNARYNYWQSLQPVPGGIAYENFELREPFHEGQEFAFGISRKTPAELGIGAVQSSHQPQ